VKKRLSTRLKGPALSIVSYPPHVAGGRPVSRVEILGRRDAQAQKRSERKKSTETQNKIFYSSIS